MGKTATNLSVILGLITIAFAGYYLFTQKSTMLLSTDTNRLEDEQAIMKAGVFIKHTQILDQINLNFAVFEDERFVDLRSFYMPVPEKPVGRTNPFRQVSEDNFTTTSL